MMTRRKSTEWVVINDLTLADPNDIDIVKVLLAERGISEKDSPSFLKPELSNIPDVYTLFDSRSAAKKIVKAIKDEKKIFIHGDFDADGICATTLLWEFLFREVAEFLKASVDIMPFIPNRKEDGYGLSKSSVEQLVEQGAQMIITVDCGVRDTSLIDEFEGVEFIITDHHQPGENFKVEKAYTLVHPMYPDNKYPQENISGTFVAFLLTQAVRKELGIPTELNERTPGLDLVAVSTVTDIMPLLDQNRIVVHHGLNQIQEGRRVGLEALMQIASLSPTTLNSYHLGFVLGPRINAVGRIGDPMDGVRLLSSRSRQKARGLASKIDKVNSDRQKLTSEMIIEAERQVDEDSHIIIVKGEDWPEGIVGLVAGKLMEKYNKPTLVMSQKDEIRGSARSLGGFNITKALESVSDTLLKFGGHAEAAGFTLSVDSYDEFRKKLIKVATEALKDVDLQRTRKIDAKISIKDINIPLILDIQRLEPYGSKNNKPLFMLENATVLKKQVMGASNNHLKLTIGESSSDKVDGVMFGCEEDIEGINIGDKLQLIGYLDINEWNGTASIQLHISEWEKTS